MLRSQGLQAYAILDFFTFCLPNSTNQMRRGKTIDLDPMAIPTVNSNLFQFSSLFFLNISENYYLLFGEIPQQFVHGASKHLSMPCYFFFFQKDALKHFCLHLELGRLTRIVAVTVTGIGAALAGTGMRI